VRDVLMETGSVYFVAAAGCAAYMADCIENVQVVAYDDLGTESVKRLQVRDLPLTVALDCRGGDYYREGQKRYLETTLSPAHKNVE